MTHVETNSTRSTGTNQIEDESRSSLPNDQKVPVAEFGEMTGVMVSLEEARMALKGRRVVVVEDEGVTQMQLRRCLVHAGLHIVATALNGRDGVAAVLRERPDIVLMDVRMPGMDGMEASEQILKALPVCIVMLTAFSDQEYLEQAHRLGVSGYIIKPITSDLLLPIMVQAYEVFQKRT